MTPRYRLRTLLIVLALGPPVLAGAWFARQLYLYDRQQWRIFDGLDVPEAERVARPY